MVTARLQKTRELDARLSDTVQSIKVLSSLQWPSHVEDKFLQAYRAGRRELPDVQLIPKDHPREIEALVAIQNRCDRSHALDNLIFKTARSYESAARMLGAIGTPAFTTHSIELYGKPDDSYRNQDLTPLDAANYFMDKTDELIGGYVIPETVADIPAERFARMLQDGIDRFFDQDKVMVLLDPDLPSRAIAGANRVRLRSSALFSELDLQQLLNHEACVHAATKLNGRRQDNLKVLALGAPRTTRTQEGIAALAELMTLSLDLVRLRRIALRIQAIAMGLEGADFIQVFERFLEAGQSEEESYQSAARCFRGGDVRGGTVFTKDSVYLKGMMEVYAFLMTCIRENRPEFAEWLFAGRLTQGDVIELAPYFETGFLAGPHYVPGWARDLRTLASTFAFNGFFTRVDLSVIKLENFVVFEEATATGQT